MVVRSRTGWRTVAALIVLTLTVTIWAPTASASTPKPVGHPASYADARPTVAPPDADRAPVYDQNGRRIYLHFAQGDLAGPRAAGPSFIPASSCQPIGRTDLPHYSGGDVSGHGWWDKGNCTSSKAHVYNALLEFYSDFTWRQKGESSVVDIYSGGGSANRSNARVFCNYISSNVSWRNVVDVDVDGQSDPSDQPYSQADVTCATERPLS
jgi:hypothetical protein